jgi:hypothetical protein
LDSALALLSLTGRVALGLVSTKDLKRTCRKQEDRLRRLRSHAIDPIAARPSRLRDDYDRNLTYDEKIQNTLRDVYEECTKARKQFIRKVDVRDAEMRRKAESKKRDDTARQ